VGRLLRAALPYWRRLGGALAASLALWLFAACDMPTVPRQESTEAFLTRHWQVPLPAQGEPPAGFSAAEAALGPEACGACHAERFAEWRGALHSHTMGAGIRWQFELLGPEESNRCLRCHAPLAEQKALLARAMAWPNAPRAPVPAYVPENLADAGLTCAACHVRGHARYGPPRPGAAAAEAPHGGFIATSAFQDSRFCATCHQFAEDGPRLAGKLREDTYAQWLAGPYAKTHTCQACHMPGQKHLWRGIHDADMLRRGLALELRLRRLAGGAYRAEIIARNRGAGHHLPTYMVPKIDLVLSLRQADGGAVELARDVIGWRADVAMQREAFDTRLAAGASRAYAHEFKAPRGSAWHVELRAEVAPREHYERMFRHSLDTLRLSPGATARLKEAIAEAAATRYTAMRLRATP
jgi:hypothetical protein